MNMSIIGKYIVAKFNDWIRKSSNVYNVCCTCCGRIYYHPYPPPKLGHSMNVQAINKIASITIISLCVVLALYRLQMVDSWYLCRWKKEILILGLSYPSIEGKEF